jgi:hypothetical protein
MYAQAGRYCSQPQGITKPILFGSTQVYTLLWASTRKRSRSGEESQAQRVSLVVSFYSSSTQAGSSLSLCFRVVSFPVYVACLLTSAVTLPEVDFSR